ERGRRPFGRLVASVPIWRLTAAARRRRRGWGTRRRSDLARIWWVRRGNASTASTTGILAPRRGHAARALVTDHATIVVVVANLRAVRVVEEAGIHAALHLE